LANKGLREKVWTVRRRKTKPIWRGEGCRRQVAGGGRIAQNEANVPRRHARGEQELLGQAPPYVKDIGRDARPRKSQSPKTKPISDGRDVPSFHYSMFPPDRFSDPGRRTRTCWRGGCLTGSGGGYRLVGQRGSVLGDTCNRHGKGKS